jgi:hypothetical protein
MPVAVSENGIARSDGDESTGRKIPRLNELPGEPGIQIFLSSSLKAGMTWVSLD